MARPLLFRPRVWGPRAPDAASCRAEEERTSMSAPPSGRFPKRGGETGAPDGGLTFRTATRSEEHTSELQSLTNLVCRLLLEKKKYTLRHQQELAASRCN